MFYLDNPRVLIIGSNGMLRSHIKTLAKEIPGVTQKSMLRVCD